MANCSCAQSSHLAAWPHGPFSFPVAYNQAHSSSLLGSIQSRTRRLTEWSWFNSLSILIEAVLPLFSDSGENARVGGLPLEKKNGWACVPQCVLSVCLPSGKRFESPPRGCETVIRDCHRRRVEPNSGRGDFPFRPQQRLAGDFTPDEGRAPPPSAPPPFTALTSPPR